MCIRSSNRLSDIIRVNILALRQVPLIYDTLKVGVGMPISPGGSVVRGACKDSMDEISFLQTRRLQGRTHNMTEKAVASRRQFESCEELEFMSSLVQGLSI